jgi:tryptophanyl-tRNA synthetase
MKQRIFSGIQPSGNLHLGNYLGAIKNWVKLQNQYDSIFCVVDLHAITVPQDPIELRKKTLEIAKIYLASGIDPKKCSIFIQSHVSEHAELAWVLNTITKVGDLIKMTQLKDKAGLVDFEDYENEVMAFIKSPSGTRVIEAIKNMTALDVEKTTKYTAAKTVLKFLKDTYINPFNESGVGLFDYPVLMAADILLYDTQVVPVGEDQLQHIEITRTLGNRFNKRFGDTFVIPEPYVQKEGMRIMGLDDPAKKMSKSAKSEYNYISLIDDPDTVRRKVKKAVTDSGSEIVYRDDKPALKNLINIYALLSEASMGAPMEASTKEVEKKYKGKGYADFKIDLAEVIIKFLEPFQERINELSDEKVLKILEDGARKVRPIARKKLDEVKKKAGFII